MWPMQEWTGLSSQDLAEAEQLKALTHPAGGGTLTALKMSSAELLQFCVPGQKSASLCLCHPQH